MAISQEIEKAGKYQLEIGKQVRVHPPLLTSKELASIIADIPDVDDTTLINYWVTRGNEKIYIEGWCNKCIAGWSYPLREEEGAYETFFEVGERLTPEIIERKAKEIGLELLEGGWIGLPNAESLFGVTYGIYGDVTPISQYTQIEKPVSQAVSFINENFPVDPSRSTANMMSSGFHEKFSKEWNGIDPSWAIVFLGARLPGEITAAAKQAGLKINKRPLRGKVKEGQIYDVYLPNVGQGEINKATTAFNKFADLLATPRAEPLLKTVVEEIAGPIVQEFQKAPIYPLSLTMGDYERLWKPQGWKIIFIGPTSTWRQDWGTWEAIRDIVQNCLDEAESYQWGYDDLGLWISDKGRGVAVADFLLGPPKMKPDWARGKFGEGMKISALAMVRDGYPVKIETVGRELFIVFLEQEVDGHVQSLAALWRPNGTSVGTTFHFIGYKGTSYSVGFAVNLPREAILFQAPSLITRPRQRYNQLIQADFPPVEPQLGEMRRAVGWKGELTAQSRIFARDIFMKEINSPYSYNLWSFELAPDRFAAKDEREMWRDVGRLWACVNRTDLLMIFLQMVKEPPVLDTDESRQVTLSHLGTDPSTGMRYGDILETNKEAWQQAWKNNFGENALIRTDDRWDATVRHLGYEPIGVNWDCRDALSRVILTDRQLVKESQERLRDVKVIYDDKLTARTRASLKLARAIINDISVMRKVGGVHAAMIPPASDRVRTAGMYGTQTEEIFIGADQLERGMSTVDTTIHEMAHHTTGAEDGEEAHNAELSRLGGLVVLFTSRGNFDEVVKDPSFVW